MPDLEQKEQEKTDLSVELPPSETPQQEVVKAEPKVEPRVEQQSEESVQGSVEAEPRPAPSTPPTTGQLPVKDLKKLDRQNQVKSLIDLALQKGIDEAIKAAKELDSAYALDEFHDTLVDELYKQLTEQGKLKKL